MLTPGIEPGLPKPQSGVLPLYYVSFLFYHFSTPFSLFHSSPSPPQIPFLLTKWLRGRPPAFLSSVLKFSPLPPPLISPIIFIRSPFLSTDRGQDSRALPILVIESPSSGFSMTLLPVGDCFLCPHGSHGCDRRLIAHLARILHAFISDWINF